MKTFLKILSVFLFIGVLLVTRLPRMGTDSLNSDEVLWNHRAEDFLTGLLTKDYAKTFQKYHPGVPLMWEISLTSLAMSKNQNVAVSSIFHPVEHLHITSQAVLNVWLGLLCIVILLFLNKALGSWWTALIMLIVLNVEPFYLGNSRILHHDAQISIYVFLALTLVYLNASKKFNFLTTILASFFLALAALEKSLFIGAYVFSVVFGGILMTLTQGWKKAVTFLLTITIFWVAFYFALFPALWVKPYETLQKIFNQSYQVGEDEGHGQIYFGVNTRDPGISFYPVLLVLKSSLFIVIGTVIYFSDIFIEFVKRIIKKQSFSIKNISFYLFVTIFYLGYFSVIEYFTKKVDRYVVALYPFLALASVYGWSKFIHKKIYLAIVPLALFIYTVIIPLKQIFPNYLLYTSFIFGNAASSNEIVGQKLFGIGVFDLRDKLISRYGDKVVYIASSDFEPLASIYPNAKIYNVLATHPNDFKIMILGPNKNFPPSLKNEPTMFFTKVDSVYIDGLEFWRIYEKHVRTLD